MELVKQEADLLVLKLENSAETEAQYPFRFVLEIQYRVMESSLEVTYHVKNRDSQIMYFGIGGHPGFQVPMEEGLIFEDYFLDFGEPSEPMRVDFSEDCFVTEKDSRFVLREGRYLDLRHDLFDDDAIVLYEMPHQVSIRSSKSSRSVQVEFPEMPYVGFWHWPKAEVPYVCIEPWSSLPSRKDRVEDLEQQENLLSLNPEAEYENTWKITIHNEKEA
jgi:galactose mutarotase-like enzyme